MKILTYLSIFFATWLLFSCSSPSEDEKILLGFMKDRMNNLAYTAYKESKIGDTVLFEVADKGFFLKGKLSWIGDYEVVTLHETEKDSSKYLSAIFAKENDVWQSVFENDLEPGKLDTIIDLNSDDKNEIIMQYYKRNATGFESKLVVYAKKEGQKYLPIGEIAPNYYRSANKKVSSTVELLQVADYTRLFVNTMEFDSLANNNENQRQVSSFYLVTTLGELQQEYTIEPILSREPLLLKVSQDNFWGIYSRIGEVVSNKPLNFMIGFADMLTSSNKTEQVLPAEYTEILTASEGLIPVKNKDGAWGFVNLKGKLVVECKYTGVSKFDKGKAVFQVQGENDWRKAYRYIDTKGKELGLFFDKISGKDCIESNVIESSTSSRNLKNCPNGDMYRQTSGETWGGSDTFYTNASLEDIIAKYAKMESEYSAMIKKVDAIDNNMEYTEDGYTFSISIERLDNNTMEKVICAKNSDMNGGSIEFEVDGTGVMVKEFYGE